MNDIYVTGHRNPDTDSIVAAVAYANLRHAMGERAYRAVRLGSVNDETQRLLDRFGVEAPPLGQEPCARRSPTSDYDRTPALNGSVPLDLAWRTMRECEGERRTRRGRRRRTVRYALRRGHRGLRYADHHPEPRG